MGNTEFIEKAKEIVREYAYEHIDCTDAYVSYRCLQEI